MPILENTSFSPAFCLGNKHAQTLYSACIRKPSGVMYKRERIATPDGDFLDLDWSKVGSKKVVVLSHGLEGSSQSSYILGMTKALNSAGFDTLAWNYRGCGGEANRTIKMYHSGATYDLDTICKHIEQNCDYQSVILIGFSLGANLTLLYLSENRETLKEKQLAAVVFSAPCDLASSTRKMREGLGKIYEKHFIGSLKNKVLAKSKLFPEQIDLRDFEKVKTFEDFDNRYIATIHGFKDAKDYWQKCSSLYRLEKINRPTLIVSALDDPILGKECYPFEIAKNHNSIFLETPERGGHNGFIDRMGKSSGIWSEQRAIQFISSLALY